VLTDEDLRTTLAVRDRQITKYFGEVVALHAPCGDAPNSLWQFDGNVDLPATSTKG
jgi:hypothetical protein